MRIIIEVKSRQVVKKVLDLLRITEWLGGIRVWIQQNQTSREELVYDFPPKPPAVETEDKIDYREFWACTQPQMGIEEIDRQIAEMRED